MSYQHGKSAQHQDLVSCLQNTAGYRQDQPGEEESSRGIMRKEREPKIHIRKWEINKADEIA